MKETNRASSNSVLLATIKLLVVALTWASTFVLVRIAVKEIAPITLAGLRFFTSGLLLTGYLKIRRFDFSALKGHWLNLLALGMLSFAIGNATIFYSLQYLESTTVSLLLNFITPIVLIFGIVWLKEVPRKTQYLGILMALAGTAIYFYPQRIPIGNSGFLALILGMFGFAGYTVLGRSMARDNKVHFLAQTAFPLLFGGAVLLAGGLILEGLPVLSGRVLLILAWLIAINTLMGYILYNQAIIHLTAIKVNIILNLSPFFTAMIAFVMLGERISLRQFAAMLVIFLGTFLVQSQSEEVVKKEEIIP